jgi:hypothetical protein
MATRTKILVVDSDLDTLSRVYLALVHRNFKTEASDKIEEIPERVKRLKPALLILGSAEYESYFDRLKLPCILLLVDGEAQPNSLPGDVLVLRKPIHVDVLMQAIEELVY